MEFRDRSSEAVWSSVAAAALLREPSPSAEEASMVPRPDLHDICFLFTKRKQEE